MQSFADVINALGGPAEYARGVGLATIERGAEMRRRNSIPAPYWQATVDLAKAKGVADVTLELLAQLAARRVDDPASAA